MKVTIVAAAPEMHVALGLFHEQKPVMVMVCSPGASVRLFYRFKVQVTALYRLIWARHWSQWSLHCCVALAGVRNNEKASVMSWQTIATEWWGSSNMLQLWQYISHQLSKHWSYSYRTWLHPALHPAQNSWWRKYPAKSVTPAWVSLNHATAARCSTTSNDANTVDNVTVFLPPSIMWQFSCHHFRWTSLHGLESDVCVHSELLVCRWLYEDATLAQLACRPASWQSWQKECLHVHVTKLRSKGQS